VDVRGDGGYIVAAPSVHASGGIYRWDEERIPTRTPLAELPAWLSDRLKPAPRAAVPTSAARAQGDIHERSWAAIALEDELAAVTSAPEGIRNDRLNRAAFALGQIIGAGLLDRGRVERELQHAAERCGLSAGEAARTIRSGLEAGLLEPRAPKDRRPSNGGPALETPRVEVEALSSEGSPQVLLPPTARRLRFPVHALPASCRRLVEEGARARGVDPAYLGVPMLPALAGAIGNAARLRIKLAYHEPAILWTAVVAPSGVMKSPHLDDIFRPHRERDRRLVEESKKAFADYQTARHQYQAARKAGEPGECPERPRSRCVLVNDITVEGLALRLQDNPRGLVLVRDELSGWIGAMDAYKRSRGADVAAFLEMHRGGELKVDRKRDDIPTVHVPHAALSIAGTIQPAILARSIGQEGRDNGLLARLFVSMPPAAFAKWTEHDVSEATHAGYARTVAALLDLEPLPAGEPQVLELSAEARKVFIAYHDEMMETTSTASDELRPAYAKLRGAALRLALVLSLTRAAEAGQANELRQVDVAAMEAGVELARWFAVETERTYLALSETPEQARDRRAVEWIEATGHRVTPGKLMGSGPRPRFTTSDEAEQFLRGLASRGFGQMRVREGGTRGGRPGVEFVLHGGGSETPAIAGEHEGSTSGHAELVGDADAEREHLEHELGDCVGGVRP
jgi:hypothetical protein